MKKINVRVINACGFWGREVGKLAGLDLPLVPVQHQVQHHHLPQLGICIIRFLPGKMLSNCNVVPSVPCDEVGARGAGAEKGNSSSQASRWIILPQVPYFPFLVHWHVDKCKCRQERDGLLIGPYESEHVMVRERDKKKRPVFVVFDYERVPTPPPPFVVTWESEIFWSKFLLWWMP